MTTMIDGIPQDGAQGAPAIPPTKVVTLEEFLGGDLPLKAPDHGPGEHGFREQVADVLRVLAEDPPGSWWVPGDTGFHKNMRKVNPRNLADAVDRRGTPVQWVVVVAGEEHWSGGWSEDQVSLYAHGERWSYQVSAGSLLDTEEKHLKPSVIPTQKLATPPVLKPGKDAVAALVLQFWQGRPLRLPSGDVVRVVARVAPEYTGYWYFMRPPHMLKRGPHRVWKRILLKDSPRCSVWAEWKRQKWGGWQGFEWQTSGLYSGMDAGGGWPLPPYLKSKIKLDGPVWTELVPSHVPPPGRIVVGWRQYMWAGRPALLLTRPGKGTWVMGVPYVFYYTTSQRAVLKPKDAEWLPEGSDAPLRAGWIPRFNSKQLTGGMEYPFVVSGGPDTQDAMDMPAKKGGAFVKGLDLNTLPAMFPAALPADPEAWEGFTGPDGVNVP